MPWNRLPGWRGARYPRLNPWPKPSQVSAGPARLIERYTGGILRDIMLLIIEASMRAIDLGLPNLPVTFLEKTWRSIQTRPVMGPPAMAPAQ